KDQLGSASELLYGMPCWLAGGKVSVRPRFQVRESDSIELSAVLGQLKLNRRRGPNVVHHPASGVEV
ncbi:hypothetical protein AVEN_88896-1, partial [Araneus ventricosus]